MNLRKISEQFIKFGLVGVSNTLAGLLIYYVLVYVGVNYLIANIVGFILTVLNSYYWNNRYVFKDRKGSHLSSIFRTYLSYGFTFLLSMGLLYLMVDILGISKYIAPIINLVITVPTNFIIMKLFAMREH